jgi:hypothetical protein
VFSETWFSKQTFVLVGIDRDKGIGSTSVAFHGFGGIKRQAMGPRSYKRLFSVQRPVGTGYSLAATQSTESLGKNPNIVPMTNSFGSTFSCRGLRPLKWKTTTIQMLPTGSGEQRV